MIMMGMISLLFCLCLNEVLVLCFGISLTMVLMFMRLMKLKMKNILLNMPKLKNIKVLIIDDNREVIYNYSSWSLAVEGFNFLLREIIENHFSARHIYMLTGDLIVREYHHHKHFIPFNNVEFI